MAMGDVEYRLSKCSLFAATIRKTSSHACAPSLASMLPDKGHPMTILTTHVGSLQRGDELAQLLLKRDHGEAVDDTHFEQVVQTALDQAVQK